MQNASRLGSKRMTMTKAKVESLGLLHKKGMISVKSKSDVAVVELIVIKCFGCVCKHQTEIKPLVSFCRWVITTQITLLGACMAYLKENSQTFYLTARKLDE